MNGVSTWLKLDDCTDKHAYPVMSSHYNVLWGLLFIV